MRCPICGSLNTRWHKYNDMWQCLSCKHRWYG